MINRLREDLQANLKNQNFDAVNAIRHLISESGREVDGKESKITESIVINTARKLIRSAKYVMLIEKGLVSQSMIARSGKDVNNVIDNNIKMFDNHLTSTYIDMLSTYVPRDPDESEIIEWINDNIDFSKYKNKMQAMKDLNNHFKGTDSKLLSSILKNL